MAIGNCDWQVQCLGMSKLIKPSSPFSVLYQLILPTPSVMYRTTFPLENLHPWMMTQKYPPLYFEHLNYSLCAVWSVVSLTKKFIKTEICRWRWTGGKGGHDCYTGDDHHSAGDSLISSIIPLLPLFQSVKAGGQGIERRACMTQLIRMARYYPT